MKTEKLILSVIIWLGQTVGLGIVIIVGLIVLVLFFPVCVFAAILYFTHWLGEDGKLTGIFISLLMLIAWWVFIISNLPAFLLWIGWTL